MPTLEITPRPVTMAGYDDYQTLVLETYARLSVSSQDITLDYVNHLERELRKARREQTIKKLDAAPNLTEARVFWRQILLPLIIKEKLTPGDPTMTFYPDTDYTEKAVAALAGKGLDIILYMRLQQSCNPEFGPDTLITMSGLEVLKYWGTKAKIAHSLGLNLRFIIGDESSGFPIDDLLGFTLEDRHLSESIIRGFLEREQLVDFIIVRPVIEAINMRLQNIHDKVILYQTFNKHYDVVRAAILEDIEQGRTTLETYRCGLFGRILTAKGRQVLSVGRSRDVADLQMLPMKSINYLAGAVAAFNALLAVRATAQQLVIKLEIPDYPEFWQPGRLSLHMGITRSANRPSLLPVGTRWQGQYVMPAHGLPVYDISGKCHGLVHHTKLPGEQSLHHIKIGQKTIGLTLNA